MEKSKVKGRKKRVMDLTVGNMAKLSQELNQLLQLKVPMKSRYYLTKLSWVSNEYANKHVMKSNELVSRLGVADPKTGNLSVPQLIKDETSGNEVVNPAYVEYQREMDAFTSEKVSVTFDEIYLDDLGSQETELNFPALFLLL